MIPGGGAGIGCEEEIQGNHGIVPDRAMLLWRYFRDPAIETALPAHAPPVGRADRLSAECDAREEG